MYMQELKLSCGNDLVVKNSIYSNGDFDLRPNDPKIKGFFPFHMGIMWKAVHRTLHIHKLNNGDLPIKPVHRT
jgi:hypothetical protein